jgi:hypothetical protein
MMYCRLGGRLQELDGMLLIGLIWPRIWSSVGLL